MMPRSKLITAMTSKMESIRVVTRAMVGVTRDTSRAVVIPATIRPVHEGLTCG